MITSFPPLKTACNILMSEVEGIFTLSNPGGVGPRNCSLTTLLFPANFQMLGLKVGGAEEEDERPEVRKNRERRHRMAEERKERHGY